MLFMFNYKVSSLAMSIKDRIKFFENLKTAEQPKPTPKLLANKLFQQKVEPSKPVADQSIKPSSHNVSIKPPVQNQAKQPSTEPSKTQLTKSAQIFVQPQPQKQSVKTDKNPEKEASKEKQPAVNVKNLRNMFQNKAFPIVQQPPIGMKSCFVPIKKSPFQQKTQTEKIHQVPKQTEERKSLPEQFQTNDGQKKLSFQEMRKIAQLLLAKNKAGLSVKEHQPEQIIHSNEQNHSLQKHEESSQHESKQIKVQLEHETQNLQEGTHEQLTRNSHESDKLFNEALKQQSENSNTLVTGQSNHLNLATRKTVARKRNNDDDFDDL